MTAPAAPPEYNATGQDFGDRRHLTYRGPLLDFHAHVMVTRPGDPPGAPPSGEGPGASTDQAALMLDTAHEFDIGPTISMCHPDDIAPLRERFGSRLLFNGVISKKALDEPDESAARLVERYLEAGVVMVKLWSAPRGRDSGLFVDAPWRIDAIRRVRAAGLRLVMVHVADPDVWFKTAYADASKFGTKADQYTGLERMIELFPDLTWIGAHMGGDVEHPDHLEALLEKYPQLHLDTSATKWMVREVPPRAAAVRDLICRRPERFLWGSDLVTRHNLPREHYVSRYWCQRTLWESAWRGASPIADPDYTPADGNATPPLHGLALPDDVLAQVYEGNARRLLSLASV